MTDVDKLAKWEIISEKDEISNQWLKVRNITFRLPNGKVMEDYYLVERADVVIVIPIRNGQTFLIREYERGVGEVGYKFPSGMVDSGESHENSATRELGEELGVSSPTLQHIGETYVDPGNLTKRAHYFLANNLVDNQDLREDSPFELFEGEWVEWEKVGTMIRNNKIKNPYVIVGWTLALARIQ